MEEIEGAWVYAIRTTAADGTSHNGGFRWPRSGWVEAPDWVADDKCGHGLHCLLAGQNSPGAWNAGGLWYALRIPTADGNLRYGEGELAGKAKCRRCEVVYCGDRAGLFTWLSGHGSPGPWYYGIAVGGSFAFVTGGRHSTVTGGYGSTVTGGYGSTVTGGDCSTVTGGDGATVTGGDHSTVTGGDCSTVTGGDGATVTGGDHSTVSGGNRATVSGGDGATVTGGDGATVTGGDHSTVTGGDHSTVSGGDGATVSGGVGACLHLTRFDGAGPRTVVAYVGEDGILPGVAYRLDDKGRFVEARQ